MPEQPPRELRWRCRRGMRELDALLTRWMDRHWSSSDDELRSAFAALLESEDDLLWDWLLGRSDPSQPDLKRIVDEIRSSPPATA
ncbi:MAG: succinate dehydrogenase assembly factor 2 [Wenzhouxiangella sp.]|nr:succinate dehydrogenase assembly factor 2 [Wenzhouxiangella sp.]